MCFMNGDRLQLSKDNKNKIFFHKLVHQFLIIVQLPRFHLKYTILTVKLGYPCLMLVVNSRTLTRLII